MRMRLFFPLVLLLALLLGLANQSCLAPESNTPATTASFARRAVSGSDLTLR
jgi:hypothetical protein